MHYIIKRLVLMIPTLFLILLINFALVQLAPGGPIEQKQAQIHELAKTHDNRPYQGAQGLSDEMIASLKVQYGFDMPADKRFWLMIENYARFDLGDSFFKALPVNALIIQKLPVTLSLGVWSFITIYSFAIGLGLAKTLYQYSWFDKSSSVLLAISYATPTLVLAILLLVLFAGGHYWQIFPLQGMVSEHFDSLSLYDKIKDYFWHLVLPLTASSVGSIASVAMLSQYSLSSELHRPYVQMAYAKGLSRQQVLVRHVFKNASLALVATLPSALIAALFAGNFLIEIIFNLDGLGRLGFEAIVQRDYPVIFGILFVFSLLSMLLQLMADLLYRAIDPRIDFEQAY